mmetsp:Transcript_2782/g.7856  ORF Transcript_2782/g.7856 Transcript_2782/m.7856 type:complete len:273 (+) Transcript_2782:1848-2666(+)
MRAEAHGHPREGVETLELERGSTGEADVPAHLQGDLLQLVEAAVEAVPLQPPGVGVRSPGAVRVGEGGRRRGRVGAAGGLHLRRHGDSWILVPLLVAWTGGALRYGGPCGLIALRQARREGHPQRVLEADGLEGVGVRPGALEVVPARHRQPHELRQHPHGGALRDHAGVHGEPHRHQQVQEGPGKRQHVELKQPRRGARLQAAAREQTGAHAQLQHRDDEVVVHLLLGHLDNVSHVLPPKLCLNLAPFKDRELLLLPELAIVEEVLPVVVP